MKYYICCDFFAIKIENPSVFTYNLLEDTKCAIFFYT